jgi:hypothetical protein
VNIFRSGVIQNPEILGPGIMIITFEFDRWVTAAGQNTAERLDVLGLDQSGHLVVAELKRDRAPDSVTMQALNYAAMVSRFSLDTLAEAYASSRTTGEITSQEALPMLQEWAPAISDETLGAPRIVLLATDFGPTVTNLALFLYENGLDITLTRVQPYRTTDGRHIVTVSRILPVPNAEDFMVKPRSGTQTRAATTSTSVEEWDWASYDERLHIAPSRLAVARQIFDELSEAIESRMLPWYPKFRKGYAAFQRQGGYNVLAIDLMWNKPLRLWVKLPASPGDLALENPFPTLPTVWVANFREWGWHIETANDIPPISSVLDLAQRFNVPQGRTDITHPNAVETASQS